MTFPRSIHVTEKGFSDDPCERCDGYGYGSDGMSKCLHCDGTGYKRTKSKKTAPEANPSQGERARVILEDAELDHANAQAKRDQTPYTAVLPVDPEAHPMSGLKGQY